MNKIGVMAGTFDPIHLGHVDFMKKSIRDHSLDKLILLIEKNPKHKQVFASYPDRLNMTILATKNLPKIEIYRSAVDNFPISAELPKIKKKHPKAEVLLLIGEDVERHIYDWPDVKNLLSSVSVIVAKRNLDKKYSKVTSGNIRKQINNSETEGLDNLVKDYINQKKLY